MKNEVGKLVKGQCLYRYNCGIIQKVYVKKIERTKTGEYEYILDNGYTIYSDDSFSTVCLYPYEKQARTAYAKELESDIKAIRQYIILRRNYPLEVDTYRNQLYNKLQLLRSIGKIN